MRDIIETIDEIIQDKYCGDGLETSVEAIAKYIQKLLLEKEIETVKYIISRYDGRSYSAGGSKFHAINKKMITEKGLVANQKLKELNDE